jgi:hypothetical protein
VNEQIFPIVGSSLGEWRIEVGTRKPYSKRWAETQDCEKGPGKKDVNEGNCSYCQGIRVQFLYYLESSKRGVPKPESTKSRYRPLS